jgi:hypothetical protein
MKVHTLSIAAITALQEAYVRKVIDTVNDLDNVLYEITNESPSHSKEWQYHMVEYINKYQHEKANQHPVGMTYFGEGREGAMDALLGSSADWISPGLDLANAGSGQVRPTYRYDTDPPAADGRKVIVSDTDHIFGVGGNENWVWKSFTRGLNPIFMDPVDDPKWEPARRAMGQTLRFANRMNLAKMVPRNDLASTGYCLANPGSEYLVYLPSEEGQRWYRRWYIRGQRLTYGLTVTVDLSASSGILTVEWSNPVTGEIRSGGSIMGGDTRRFTSPFGTASVLYLSARKDHVR